MAVPLFWDPRIRKVAGSSFPGLETLRSTISSGVESILSVHGDHDWVPKVRVNHPLSAELPNRSHLQQTWPSKSCQCCSNLTNL
eukprot:1328909-Amphidinium_carterae.1